ncbi:MAG: DNA polymerase III subunit gamma/tau [Clostridia bacterium]|nr:DNA polymerase III subunit gamma/tau [Clostridia bacterium]
MYRVLYRKWRPQVFADVIGQPQVTKTLSYQIRENRLAHAYLFTGSRGTGKTTCAKIFAKAVNCLHPVNGDPCNECEICRGIDNGTVLDIVEIDAASNNGVDDIRLLRDEVNFTPSQATYRVYIIDEVHMLSIAAFNALLKTLEEPPEHVKFILATTEVHKLPSTILSRCQRFDFRRIEPSCIADRLVEIAKAENASLDYDAAVLIARIADGGMRDALSLLDRCLSVANDVTVDVVSSSAGLMSREYIYDLMDAVAARDTAKCLAILDELHKASCDTERLCVELIDRFRSFLIIKTVAHPENLIVCTAEELERIKASAASFTEEYVLYALGVLAAASEAIRRTQNRRIEAEMALIRLCRPETDVSVTALTARVAELEKELGQLKNGAVIPAPVYAAPAAKPVSAASPSPAPAQRPAEPQPKSAPAPEEPPFEEEAFFDDAPFDDDAPPIDDEPPFDDAPPIAAPQPPVNKQRDFAGFAADKPSSGSFAAKFAAEGTEETDDEPFDFDAFMNAHKDRAGSGNAAEKPADEALPFDGPFEAPPARPQIPAGEAKGSPIDGKTWLQIVLATEKKFAPLIGMLTDSTAVIKGGDILIRLGDNKLRPFINRDYLNRYVGEAARETLGQAYQIKLE